jgi:hypothetical protein
MSFSYNVLHHGVCNSLKEIIFITATAPYKVLEQTIIMKLQKDLMFQVTDKGQKIVFLILS